MPWLPWREIIDMAREANVSPYDILEPDSEHPGGRHSGRTQLFEIRAGWRHWAAARNSDHEKKLQEMEAQLYRVQKELAEHERKKLDVADKWTQTPPDLENKKGAKGRSEQGQGAKGKGAATKRQQGKSAAADTSQSMGCTGDEHWPAWRSQQLQ